MALMGHSTGCQDVVRLMQQLYRQEQQPRTVRIQVRPNTQLQLLVFKTHVGYLVH